MKIYMVQRNSDPEQYWDFENDCYDWLDTFGCYTSKDYDETTEAAKNQGGKVVTLVEASQPIEVSEAEKQKLDRLMLPLNQPGAIVNPMSYLVQSTPGEQLRLLQALKRGYTVVKPKHYVLPMPGTEHYARGVKSQGYVSLISKEWRPDLVARSPKEAAKQGWTVTKAEIDAGPDWVQHITPVEVPDDDTE